MKSLSTKILEQIPIEHIYRFLEQKNASKKQNGGSKVGLSTASRKAKIDALEAMARQLAK
ncbi:hypothetical protein CEY12_06005 [Chryseobacterium sp. T16E-39]|uniref:hypothetical protein n=1 Tax=Chryseobacterium sp. T16E-39 TaxID=2015076 RepID=UPI000B5B1AAF|nr:hypothetical protein [Chryseobacterium sp. T16E-39]ASK29684.1 hypothetical protein CEY12_06005 [Chryseobacterium sp. T16E-39]